MLDHSVKLVNIHCSFVDTLQSLNVSPTGPTGDVDPISQFFSDSYYHVSSKNCYHFITRTSVDNVEIPATLGATSTTIHPSRFPIHRYGSVLFRFRRTSQWKWEWAPSWRKKKSAKSSWGCNFVFVYWMTQCFLCKRRQHNMCASSGRIRNHVSGW
jgi:hypothetical protein